MDGRGLHPELLRIRQEYEDLYEAVTSGQVSEDEARDLLRNITALDGGGAVWSFDPHTGNLVRAVPGLPPQQASPEMFVATQGGPAPQSTQPPIPALGGTPTSGDPYDDGDDDFDDAPPRRLGGGRAALPRLDPRAVRPVLVGVLVLAVSAFLLFSGSDRDAGTSPPPDTAAPALETAPEQLPPPPSAVTPEAPTVLSPLPQVVLDASGSPERLDRAAVERLFEGVLAGESEVFSAAPERWTRVYALPLLGAAVSGWTLTVSEWVVAPDGRDRLTMVLTHPEFPTDLRWWAYVEPEGGLWLFSELRPLSSR